jgi:hypothetical protein
MSEAKQGREFIKHELDEAIAFQSVIVETGRSLGRSHPDAESRRLIKEMVTRDERQLRELLRIGKPFGATGKEEEVVTAMAELARATAEKAGDADSEAYEAHAVLVTLKRKQQDGGAAVVKIARAFKDTDMRDAARQMLRDTKRSAQELADALAAFAVTIATAPTSGPRRA